MIGYPPDADGQALAGIAASGSDMAQPMVVDFMVAVPDQKVGEQVAELARGLGYATEVELDEGEDGVEDDEPAWTCYCSKEMVATYEGVVAAQAELDALAKPLGGFADGWGSYGNGQAR